jgi:hypothetical protein
MHTTKLCSISGRKVSWFVSDPRRQHWDAARKVHVWLLLRCSSNDRIFGSKIHVTGYCDADYGGDLKKTDNSHMCFGLVVV